MKIKNPFSSTKGEQIDSSEKMNKKFLLKNSSNEKGLS